MSIRRANSFWSRVASCWSLIFACYGDRSAVENNSCCNLDVFVSSLTLTSGERIRPQKLIPILEPYQNSNNKAVTKKSIWNLPALEDWATRRGLKEHHLKSIYPSLLDLPLTQQHADVSMEQLYHKLVQNSFPKRHAQNLVDNFLPITCSIRQVLQDANPPATAQQDTPQATVISDDTSTAFATRTTKLLVDLPTGKSVETVLLVHRNRATVCVSSQVGCARACAFCATGTMGFLSHLGSSDILEQVYLAQCVLREQQQCNATLMNENEIVLEKIRNVVFMGMVSHHVSCTRSESTKTTPFKGEPLDNYANVHEACRGLTHQQLFGLPARHITISTVGASPRYIRLLAVQAPSISLAVSLHGATQELREELLPSAARSANFEELSDALQFFAVTTNRTIMLEYLLIAGVNDTPHALQSLVHWLQKSSHDRSSSSFFYVNLIPYNPTAAGAAREYQAPSHDQVLHWADTLRPHAKVHVRWSTMSGRTTFAACGQLAMAATNTTL